MLKNIAFDLDGTLWHTENIYIYAYHKACDEYGITNPLPDCEVAKFVTASFNELMDGLFPWAKNDPEFLKKSITYSREFALNNPEKCLYPGIKELLATMAKDYSIYLVSNCPRPFAELFLEVSGSRELFSAVYTMEDGKKSIHLKEIANDGKTIFLGDSPSDRDATNALNNTSFCWASYGYSKCVLYDYKIKEPSELKTVIQKIK